MGMCLGMCWDHIRPFFLAFERAFVPFLELRGFGPELLAGWLGGCLGVARVRVAGCPRMSEGALLAGENLFAMNFQAICQLEPLIVHYLNYFRRQLNADHDFRLVGIVRVAAVASTDVVLSHRLLFSTCPPKAVATKVK